MVKTNSILTWGTCGLVAIGIFLWSSSTPTRGQSQIVPPSDQSQGKTIETPVTPSASVDAPSAGSLVSTSDIKQGLTPLLLRLEASPDLKFPLIHTTPYCNALEGESKQECLAAKDFGLELHKAILEYQATMQSMTLPEFSLAFRRLALLRDRLWQRGTVGNILLSDTVDRITFWRLLNRVAQSEPEELQQLDSLRSHYKQMILDWKSVARAFQSEYGVKLNTTSLPKQREDENYQQKPLYATTVIVYSNIANDIGWKRLFATGEEEYMDVISLDVPQILESGYSGPFFSRYASSASTDAGIIARAAFLRDFIILFKNAHGDVGRKVMNLPKPTGRQIESFLIRKSSAAKIIAPEIFKKRPAPQADFLTPDSLWSTLRLLEQIREPLIPDDNDPYYGFASGAFA